MAPDLSGGEHRDVTFEGLDLAQETIEGAYFEDCTFVDCVLPGLVLEDCELTGCRIEGGDLSLLRPVATRFSEVTFHRAKLLGVDWTLAAWPRLSVSGLVAFAHCTLDDSSFMGLRLPEVAFHHCSLVDVDLSECDLSRATFVGSRLDRAHFGRTDLRGAHLEGATGYRIDVRSNQVGGATASLPDAASFLGQLGLVLVEPPAPPSEEPQS